MEPVTWGFIGTLVGAVVGASASIFTTLITGWNSRKLQKEAAVFERSERAREFQRNNLLELQDALTSGMRLIGRAHLEDVESFRKSKDDARRTFLTEELNQELLISSRNLAILTERIADDSLRESIKALRGEMTNVLMAKSASESDQSIQQVSSTFEKTMENLGVVLRGSY
jgi:gas vesicle protein